MILLAVTLCLAARGEAECQRHVRWVQTPQDCRQIGEAMAEYLKASELEGVTVIFIGRTCSRGTDG
jgi:ABC-type branched-subunit amino acid transport system substrate-binding protein